MSNKYLDIINPAIDQYGMIAQLAGDGGDSAQREGMFLLLSFAGFQQGKITQAEYDAIVARYLSVFDRLRLGCMPGEIRRHDGSGQWYDLSKRMSRDQWTPNAISIGLVGGRKRQFDMILGMVLRGTIFTTNIYANGDTPGKAKIPDFTLGSSHGFILRWSKVFWLANLFTDVELLVNSCIWLFKFKYKQEDSDCLNHVNALVQAKYRSPTPLSWFARKILPLKKIQNCLDSYFGN